MYPYLLSSPHTLLLVYADAFIKSVLTLAEAGVKTSLLLSSLLIFFFQYVKERLNLYNDFLGVVTLSNHHSSWWRITDSNR